MSHAARTAEIGFVADEGDRPARRVGPEGARPPRPARDRASSRSHVSSAGVGERPASRIVRGVPRAHERAGQDQIQAGLEHRQIPARPVACAPRRDGSAAASYRPGTSPRAARRSRGGPGRSSAGFSAPVRCPRRSVTSLAGRPPAPDRIRPHARHATGARRRGALRNHLQNRAGRLVHPRSPLQDPRVQPAAADLQRAIQIGQTPHVSARSRPGTAAATRTYRCAICASWMSPSTSWKRSRRPTRSRDPPSGPPARLQRVPQLLALHAQAVQRLGRIDRSRRRGAPRRTGARGVPRRRTPRPSPPRPGLPGPSAARPSATAPERRRAPPRPRAIAPPAARSSCVLRQSAHCACMCATAAGVRRAGPQRLATTPAPRPPRARRRAHGSRRATRARSPGPRRRPPRPPARARPATGASRPAPDARRADRPAWPPAKPRPARRHAGGSRAAGRSEPAW